MKIEELSIGDWVRMGGGNFQIYHLTLAGDVYGYIRTNNGCTGEEYYDGEIGDVQPIPLTPEILEKNGFKRKQYTIDIPDVQEIGYDGYLHILCQDGVQYDIILVDSCEDYFDLEIESSLRNKDGDRILISSELSLNYVEYVHQLQRAMKLAGIEKEIIL